MMGLESADENTCIYKHALNAIRINALAANGFIAQKRRCAIVAFSPFVKLAGPFSGLVFCR